MVLPHFWLADFLTFINSQRWLHGEYAWQPPALWFHVHGNRMEQFWLEQQRFSVAHLEFLKKEDMLEQAFFSLNWHPEAPQCEDLESEDAIRAQEEQELHDSFNRSTGLKFLSNSSDSSDAYSASSVDFEREYDLELEHLPPDLFGVRWMNKRGPDVGNGFISRRLALRRRAVKHWLRYY